MIFEGYSLEPRWWWWRRVIASAFIVTGLHAGLVAYAYLMPAPEEATEEAQGAFMLELAPLPVAAAADAAAPGPTAEVTQAQIDEKTPTEEVPEVKPPEEVPLPVAPDPELAMPVQKPIEEPKEEKEEEEKPIEKVEVKEEKKEDEPEIQEAKPQEAMVQAGGPPTPSSTPAPKTAAQRQGTTDRPSDEVMTWSKALIAAIRQRRGGPAIKVRFRCASRSIAKGKCCRRR